MKSQTLRSALAVAATATALLAATGTAHAAPTTPSPAPAAAGGAMDAQLQVKYGSKCLTIAGGSLRNGAHAIEGTCDTTALHQVFTVRPGETTGWEIVAAHSGRCLTHRASSTAAVVQDWCNGSPAQRWTMQFLEGAELNLFQLRPVDAPGECLSMGGTPAGEEPTAYVVDCFTNLPSQEWRLAFVN
ncbi:MULTISPECIES: RICIN domain-containing protein [unclassified Streptomyces]|uniref:RICIN domain-containing protein n=1 Tax=unclassified Streptomyces TaxID=2593676 RepID=UPI0029675A1A|nr:RICIN domain-containing protein [Streptomyces sp. SJL17-1]